MKKLRWFLLACMIVLPGCSREMPKGGTTVYATVTGMKINTTMVYPPFSPIKEYLVRVETEPASPYHMTITSTVLDNIYTNITFGTRVPIVYTGFDNEWVIQWDQGHTP